MTGDPYESPETEAKVLPVEPARKNRKLVMAGLVLAGIVFALIIVGNVVKFVISGRQAQPAAVRPTTMTKRQGDSFAEQQAGEATYLKGVDKRDKRETAEDTVLGKGSDLAGDADPYDEAAGVPRKTKAQDDAEHGRAGNSGGGQKSAAQLLRERTALEAAHRRENDLDSSPVSVDFSDYFERTSTAASAAKAPADEAENDAQPKRRHTPLVEDPEGSEDEPANAHAPKTAKAHNPAKDYEFDSSFGKLYRLMEDTVMETVLVNRLAGAAAGPVICMVVTDVYDGQHLLIPKGTRMLGRVTAVSGTNQERLFVAFHRAIMPDGYSVSLDKFQGLDVVGQTGLRDLVNHHYLQIFGTSVALAAISATSQIGNNVGAYGSYSWGTQMRTDAGSGLGQSAQRVMERFLNILPTFTIRERARVTIMLSGDLLLPDTKNHSMDPEL